MSKIYSNDIRLIKRKNSALKVIILILMSVVLATVILGGGMGLSGVLAKKGFVWFKTNQLSINSLNYYAVHFGEFENENDASKCAIWTSTSGGAAYVYKNGQYLVTAQIYSSIDSANKVINGLSNDLMYEAKVKQFKTEKIYFKVEDISVADKRKLKKIINLVGDMIDKILEISNKLDMGTMSNVIASSEINSLKSSVKINKTHIDAINSTYNNKHLSNISDYYLRVADSLDVCVNKLLTSENYMSACKYSACEIFLTFYDFVANFVN